MSSYLASEGVTSFCAATMTIPFSRIEKILENARLFQLNRITRAQSLRGFISKGRICRQAEAAFRTRTISGSRTPGNSRH